MKDQETLEEVRNVMVRILRRVDASDKLDITDVRAERLYRKLRAVMTNLPSGETIVLRPLTGPVGDFTPLLGHEHGKQHKTPQRGL